MSNEELDASLRRLETVASLVVLCWMLFELYEQKIRLLAMKTAKRLQVLAGRAARRLGEAEMRRELDGRRPAYEISFTLSKLREAAGVLYERLRSQ